MNTKEIEINVEFMNLKLFKERKFQLKGSNIYIVAASNKKGKTTFLNALKSAQLVKDDTPNPLKDGEQSGAAIVQIPGADGKMYVVKEEFDGEVIKFKMYDNLGVPVKAIGEMRDKFKYVHFTVDEFMKLSESEEGRRKQRTILLNLLPEDIRKEYEELSIRESIAYKERTGYNKACETNKKLMDSYALNEAEKLSMTQKQEAEDALKVLKDSIANASNPKAIIEEIEKHKNTSKELVEKSDDLVEHFKLSVKRYDDDIAEYESKIAYLRKEKEAALDKIKNINDGKAENLLMIAEKVMELQAKLEGIDQKSLIEIQARIDKGEEFIKGIQDTIRKKEKYEDYKKAYDETLALYKEQDDKVNTCREKKKTIIANAKFPVDIDISDDKIIVEGFDFHASQTCKSTAGKILLNIMAKINPAPVQIFGSADDYDWESLEELEKIAQENGKILFLDHHMKENHELVVVGIEQFKEILNKQEVKPKKDLF